MTGTCRFFFFQAEDGIRDLTVTGVQTCALPISDAQFLAALRRGVRDDGARLYPAMPFTSYTFLTDADALAIKAYLFSLAPVHAPDRADTLSFPFNQRWLLGVWSWLFNPDQRFQANPAQSPEWNRSEERRVGKECRSRWSP